jgi:hypothetical protein
VFVDVVEFEIVEAWKVERTSSSCCIVCLNVSLKEMFIEKYLENKI